MIGDEAVAASKTNLKREADAFDGVGLSHKLFRFLVVPLKLRDAERLVEVPVELV